MEWAKSYPLGNQIIPGTDFSYLIAWSVADSDGVVVGIGSRYFTIQNVAGESANSGGTGTKGSLLVSSSPKKSGIRSASEVDAIPEDRRMPVYIKRGYADHQIREITFPESEGSIHLEIPEVSRTMVSLNEKEIEESPAEREARSRRILSGLAGGKGKSRYEAFELVLGQLRPLPIGASFDSRDGVLYWQPGPGFLGEYGFVIIDTEKMTRKTIKITIVADWGSNK